jgi:hypothetical protein
MLLNIPIKPAILLILALGLCSNLGQAQQLAPIGVVTNSIKAMIGSAAVSEGATVFSGDLLRTGDQGRLSVQSGTVQFALGENSSARIFRNGTRTIVEIERGTLAYTAKGANEDITLFALDVRMVPKTVLPAAVQVSIISRCEVTVTAFRSTIDVTSGRETRTVEESGSFRVLSDFGVDYRDSWQPVLADYPEYPREAGYHRSHGHVACPAAVWQAPVTAMAGGHFREIAIGIALIVTIPAVHEVFESPDRP